MAVYHAEGKTGNVRKISRRKVRHLDSAPAEAKLSNTRRDAIARETFDAFVMDLGLATFQELMEEEVNSLVGVLRANIVPIVQPGDMGLSGDGYPSSDGRSTSFIPAYAP